MPRSFENYPLGPRHQQVRRIAVSGPANRPADSTSTAIGSPATSTGDRSPVPPTDGTPVVRVLEDVEMSFHMRTLVPTVLEALKHVERTQLRRKDWCTELRLGPRSSAYDPDDDSYSDSCSACASGIASAGKSSAEPVTAAGRSRLNATFWPSLEHRLEYSNSFADRSWSHLGLECLVCHEPLLFEGQYDEHGNPMGLNALISHCARRHPDDEVAVVLPCGHIIGHKCLTTLRDMPGMPTCPMCRSPGQYAHCECVYEDLPAPRDAEQLQDFPFTAVEGFVLPQECDNCRWNPRRDRWHIYMRALLVAMVPSLISFVPLLLRSKVSLRERHDIIALAERQTAEASEDDNIERLINQLVLMFRLLETLRRSGHIKRSWAAPRAPGNSLSGMAELIRGEVICGEVIGGP